MQLTQIENTNIFEQYVLAMLLQMIWSDNNVSFTLIVKNETDDDVIKVLELAKSNLKGISLLYKKDVVYEQMPLESIKTN